MTSFFTEPFVDGESVASKGAPFSSLTETVSRGSK
jgi:hypothetical protein